MTAPREFINPKMNWKQLTKAGNIYEPGNSMLYETGDWRTSRPIIDREKCINCLICWRYCPDASIIPDEGNFGSFDYKHCKGCGICASVCPVHVITMVSEDDIEKEEEAKENGK